MVTKKLIPEDLLLLKALSGKGCTIRDLAALSLDKNLIKKRVRVLKKLGLISKSESSRTYLLTATGYKLVESGDIHLIEPYSPGETVRNEFGFRFAVGEGLYTGDIALSYAELAELIGKVDARSLTFHLYRGDFERWVLDVFQDRKTARKLKRLALKPMSPDRLRSRLIRIFSGNQNEEN
jgi:predicted transcriptional regulator